MDEETVGPAKRRQEWKIEERLRVDSRPGFLSQTTTAGKKGNRSGRAAKAKYISAEYLSNGVRCSTGIGASYL